MPQTGPVTLFLSYAHADEPFCQELNKHLSSLQRQGLISTWYDRQIIAGSNWAQKINEQIQQASIILLLISADFLASDYCYSHEMTQALERQAGGSAQVIPLLVRPCDWSGAPFAHLQGLPTDARPISTWPDQDEAWTNVVEGIRNTLEHLSVPWGDTPSISTSPTPQRHSLSPSTLEQRNRARFLAKLSNSYSHLLRASLQGAAQMPLIFHSKPDAIADPVRLRLRQPSLPEQPLPAETTLLQVFDHISGELLILGDPGTGKTTLLLNLAEVLYERAKIDEHAPIPVVVNLSTWATKRKPLAEWLVEEIMKSYEVPRDPIAYWVQQSQILPLLDGLDEVDMSVLPACIEAINTFKRQYLMPLVVCCRTGDYDAQQRRLVLQNAVIIQPLEKDQVDAYLKAAGSSLAGIRSILRKNAELRALVSTPLMLRVVTLAYQGVSVQALPRKGTMQEQQRQIFQQYIERMLTQLPPACFAPQSMIQWTSQLAQQMRTSNLTVFYLEHLQPEWLPPRWQWIYQVLAVRLYGVLVGILVSILVNSIVLSPHLDVFGDNWVGLTGGWIGWLMSRSGSSSFQSTTLVQGWKQKIFGILNVSNAMLIGVGIGWIYMLTDNKHSYGYPVVISMGLCAFFLSSIIKIGKMTQPPDLLLPYRQKRPWNWLIPRRYRDHLRFGAFVGLVLGLSLWFNDVISRGLWIAGSSGEHDSLGSMLSYGLQEGAIVGVSVGLRFGIIGTLLSLLLLNSKGNIVLTEIIAWSARRLGQSLFSMAHLKETLRLFLVLGLFLELSLDLFWTLDSGLGGGLSNALFGLSVTMGTGLRIGLSISLIYWVLLGIWKSFSQEILDDRHRRTPNQGMRRSVRNGILLGFIAFVLCGLVALLNATLNIITISDENDLVLRSPNQVSRSDLISNLLHLLFDIRLRYAVTAGIIGALLVALLTGVLAGLRHLLLRILLARTGQLPWNAVHFLDEATRRILLYRDGGGYRFIHRLFLNHFADLASSAPSDQPETPE